MFLSDSRGLLVRRLVVRLAWVAWLASAGCTSFRPRTVPIDSAAGMYRNVNVTYRVDTGQLMEPLVVSRIAGRRIARQQIPSSPYANRSVARLTLQYPHPEGKEGYALAEVVIETRAPRRASRSRKGVWQQWTDSFADAARDLVPGLPGSDTVYEAWSMDLPRNELDRAIGGLSQGGFFVSPPRPSVGVELDARIDGYQSLKRWTHVPELDTLLEHVRQEGQLVSYTHPIDSDQPVTAVAGQEPNAGGGQIVWHDTDGPSLAAPSGENFGPPAAAQMAAPGGYSLVPIPDPITVPPGQSPALPSRSARPRMWQLPPQYRRQIPQYGPPPATNFAGPPAVRSQYVPSGAKGPSAFPPPGSEPVSGEQVISDVPVNQPRRPFLSRWGAQRAGAEAPSGASATSGDGPLRRFFTRPSTSQSGLQPPPGMPEPPRGTGMDNYYPR